MGLSGSLWNNLGCLFPCHFIGYNYSLTYNFSEEVKLCLYDLLCFLSCLMI